MVLSIFVEKDLSTLMYFKNFMDMTFYMKTDYGSLLLEFLLQFKYYLVSITKINGDLSEPQDI